MTLIFLSCALFWSFAFTFTFCEFGQRVNNAFSEIDDAVGQFEWYSFPIENQRMLPTIIIIAQKPVVIECFGEIQCLRCVFKKVCSNSKLDKIQSEINAFFQVTNSGFSYFMMLRQFGN